MSLNLSITHGRLALAILPFLFLHGCASTDAGSARSTPQGEQPAQLEARLDSGLRQAQTAAAEARELAISLQARQDAQDARGAEQAQQLATLQRQLTTLAGEDKGARLAQELKQEMARQLAQTEARIQANGNAADAALNDRMAQLEKRLDEVARMAEDALAAMGLGPRKILGKVVHSVTLTDDKTLFPINSPDLGEKDLAKLNAVADFVKNLDVNYHLAIHGHTDGLGSDDYNYALGKARAEVVKSYLHEKRGIPLLRMSVISHGALDVSAYREGANRRIVVEVLQ